VKFSFISIHPQLALSVFSEGLLQKAISKNLLSVEALNPRDFADPPHFRVDDKPYGGGAGMVMKCEPIVRTIRKIKTDHPEAYVVVSSAKGRRFTQSTAKRMSKKSHLVFICGRYEGIDERVIQYFSDEEVRVGDAVIMGGEMACAYMVEAIARLLPGIVGNPESLVNETFSTDFPKEYVQYTRPQKFEGYSVPEVLLKGDHAAIRKWRRSHLKD
jgi:tRNA (guanine37-N1)-methyltransferase